MVDAIVGGGLLKLRERAAEKKSLEQGFRGSVLM